MTLIIFERVYLKTNYLSRANFFPTLRCPIGFPIIRQSVDSFVCITDGLLGRGDTAGHRVRGHVGRSDGARRWDSETDVSGQGISETARVVAERRRPGDSHQGR